MSPSERDVASVWDMVQAIAGILQDTKGFSLDAFLGDRKTRRAVERELEILGEAARRISPEFQQLHPEIDWRNTLNLRNLTAYRYETVSYEELWRIVQDVLPGMKADLEAMLPPLP